jgi:hypothetical protein
MRRVAGSLVLLSLLAGCGALAATPPPAPEEADARARLDRLIDSARAGDFERFCELAASPTCERLLDGVEDLVPEHRPRLALSTVYQPVQHANGYSSGGVLFVVCGSDAEGREFESEVFISQNADGSLFATAPVWWTGTRVAIDDPAAGGPTTGRGPERSRCE